MKTQAGVGSQGENLDLQGIIDLSVKRVLGMQEFISGGDLARLAAIDSEMRFILRFYHSDSMAMPGGDQATSDFHWAINNIPPHLRHLIIGVIPANEQNLDVEHAWVPYAGFWKSEEGYRAIDKWLVQWAHTWRQLAQRTDWRPELWWPALSPGHNTPGQPPESEYALLRASMAAYDRLCIHVYGNEDAAQVWSEWVGIRRLERIRAAMNALGFEDKLKPITEVNRVNFKALLEYLEQFPDVNEALWFLYRSAKEDHRAFDLKWPWTDGLREYIVEQQEEEEPMPILKEQFPVIYKQWVETGGDPEADFRRHLWGINAPWLPQPNDGEFAKLCEDGKSLLEQIKLIGLRRSLPKV
ncbi:MAG: hypothetical protein V3V32_04545 [Dehalococcoidia bacterium]